jgi:hypothetical protein
MSGGIFGDWEHMQSWVDDDGVVWVGRPPAGALMCPRSIFVRAALQELLRLIVDVQQNRNRPEGMA